MWDKLCLRSQGSWERETVEKMWGVVENVWNKANVEMEAWVVQEEEGVEGEDLGWIERVLGEYGWTEQNRRI
jgi:hypothetical protein